jgi:hypothetical protein
MDHRILKKLGLFLTLLVLCCTNSIAKAQSKKTVTGKVTDTLGKPIPGVVVADDKQPIVGTQTDNNGNFIL